MKINTDQIARSLVQGVVNNTVNGRASGEIIPYFFVKINKNVSCGISLHYDSKVGLNIGLYAQNIQGKAYDEISECIAGYLFDEDVEFPDEFYNNIIEHPITKEEGATKTYQLIEAGTVLYC